MRAPAGAATAIAAVLAVAATPGIASAAPPAGAPTQIRVRELTYRVRDLDYSWRALDGSERVQETAARTTVTFAADVLFEFDRAEVTPAARTRLDELAGQLKGLGARPVTVTGHTDGKGDDAYNQDLSLRRARAVESVLSGGVGAGFTFEVSGLGETKPVAPDQKPDGSDDPEGRARNRRVEVGFPTG
jgi:outer membrane protein OmpA-like peptidoglycan-associated protein